MQSKVAPYAATPDPTYGRSQPGPSPHAAAEGEDGAAESDEADLRLVIEEDQVSGAYLYRTLNRRTGEVVQELPRDEVLRMSGDADYHAGGVIRTKA